MSWLPQEKLTAEEKEVIQDYNRRKATLLGKYNTHIKDLDTAHETWIGNFTTQHKKRLQRCQELYATEQHKIDKTTYSTDELQVFAIYKQALDTYKETKDKATIKYNKDLEVLETELDKVAKKINKNIQERSAKKEEEKREQVLQTLKEDIKGIAYDIKKVDKAIEEEDSFINRPEILALDKVLARRYHFLDVHSAKAKDQDYSLLCWRKRPKMIQKKYLRCRKLQKQKKFNPICHRNQQIPFHC